MTESRSLSDLYQHIHEFAPSALVLEDDTKQLVIETGLRIGNEGMLVKCSDEDAS